MLMSLRPAPACAVAVVSALAVPCAAQTVPLESFDAPLVVDSGFVTNATNARGAIFTTVVQVPGAAWVRLAFDRALLGKAPDGGAATELRVTSFLDGASQTLDARDLANWRDTSAYFNGPLLRIELIADPGAAPSRVSLSSATAGVLLPPEPDSICGPTDDRVLSDDPRCARVVPIGCSVWLIDDYNHCFLTAGHCDGGLDVVQFNVPLSSSSGAYQQPGPEDQYPVDPVSVQTNGGQGIGNDWAYFGTFENSETGRTAAEIQGDWFVLAPEAPPLAGQMIRITGYGTTSSPVPPQWNGVQKTHAGPYEGRTGTSIQYMTDTTGGNSGSPVIDESTGMAIGIHTHAGCSSGGGANNGTAIDLAGLQAALADPQGVCRPALPIAFVVEGGRPETIAPIGGTLRVTAVAQNGGAPEPGTGILHYDTGAGFTSVPMVEVEANVYDAVFPDLVCGSTVAYYFEAQATDGQTVVEPFGAPAESFSALAALGVETTYQEDFELGLGWTVANENLDDGPWDRGTPVGGGDRGDPATDFDGSGQCYLTDNVDGNSDVDGGPTRLTSPRFDLAAVPDPFISYARWFTSDDDDADALVVEISDDNGSTWTTIDTADGQTSGWTTVVVRVEDFVAATKAVRLRFSASDNPNDSVAEGGVDDVRVITISCGGVPGDIDGDGDVDFEDLLEVLVGWGPCPDCPADLDGSGEVDLADLLMVLANWT